MPADLPLALAPEVWRKRERLHQARVDAWTNRHLERAEAGRRHPVEDFLFRYYPYRPGQLRRWHPGTGTALADGADRLGWRSYGETGAVDGSGRAVRAVGVDVDDFLARRSQRVEASARLLRATAQRPPLLGCFGLHEWAMVYRADDLRHEDWPLRLGRAGTDAVVEAQPLRCTHIDAFRFFTEPARPLNAHAPTRQTQVALEQPGCLHASMDLYKWAYQLSPAVGSDLVADCFSLARDVREVDMRASPYDLTALGLEPVPVETPAGRAEYVVHQRAFAARAQVLRAQLLGVCDSLLADRSPMMSR